MLLPIIALGMMLTGLYLVLKAVRNMHHHESISKIKQVWKENCTESEDVRRIVMKSLRQQYGEKLVAEALPYIVQSGE